MAAPTSKQLKPNRGIADSRLRCNAVLVLALSLVFSHHQLAAQANDSALIFAVVGDVPYGDKALAQFPELVASIEASAAEFVIHLGDIKGGSASCSDEMIASRIQAIDAIKKPTVYIPGDNDWTDCHRRRAGRFSPLERLGFLRQQAFKVTGQSLGQPFLAVESQASQAGFEEFPEHQRWTQNNTAFIALHVLGSANGFEGFSGRTQADDAEAVRRIEASIAWLRSSMELAINTNVAAIVVAIHGNPFALSPSRAARYDMHPYAALLAQLKQQSVKFGKPVLLIHGDTHSYKFDQPFTEIGSDAVLTNLYRLEGIGDPAIGWVETSVDSNSSQGFSVIPHYISR
ncbi:MAG: hypothetical protein ACI95C_002522 [Pseudohongiellaceae bacterium]|jgi:hypothetical protein